jgi:hypothetical protein
MSQTIGQTIVRYAGQNECYGLNLFLNQVDELLEGPDLAEALYNAALNGSVECVKAIVESKVFSLLENRRSILAKTIQEVKPENPENKEILAILTKMQGGKRRTKSRKILRK